MRFGLTRAAPYPIPFRSLYSRNVENLMMAGRCISASHIGFCTIKLMKTGGHTGVATGAAAFLCKKHGTTPRGVYEKHIKELQDIVCEREPYRDTLKPVPPPRGKQGAKAAREEVWLGSCAPCRDCLDCWREFATAADE